MKRTDITELFPDAPKETIDKIMSLNGADVNAAKADVDNLRKQLAEAQSKQTASAGEELQKAQQQIEQLNKELTGMRTAETIRLTREKVATEKKIPVHLLTGETEEACAKQADEILAFAQPSGYPQFRDAGEPQRITKAQTRDKFADWAKENL